MVNEENAKEAQNRNRSLMQNGHSHLNGKRGSTEAKNSSIDASTRDKPPTGLKEQFFNARTQLHHDKSRKSNHSQQPRTVEMAGGESHPSEMRPKEIEKMFSGSEEEGGETPYSGH